MKKKIISYAITCVIIAVLTILAIIFGGDKEITKKQIDAYRFDSPNPWYGLGTLTATLRRDGPTPKWSATAGRRT